MAFVWFGFTFVCDVRWHALLHTHSNTHQMVFLKNEYKNMNKKNLTKALYDTTSYFRTDECHIYTGQNEAGYMDKVAPLNVNLTCRSIPHEVHYNSKC